MLPTFSSRSVFFFFLVCGTLCCCRVRKNVHALVFCPDICSLSAGSTSLHASAVHMEGEKDKIPIGKENLVATSSSVVCNAFTRCALKCLLATAYLHSTPRPVRTPRCFLFLGFSSRTLDLILFSPSPSPSSLRKKNNFRQKISLDQQPLSSPMLTAPKTIPRTSAPRWALKDTQPSSTLPNPPPLLATRTKVADRTPT